jgi:hypothetical protein
VYNLNPVDPKRLKPPGFNPRACEVKTRFQTLLSQIRNVCRYSKVVVEEAALKYINDFYGVEGGAWA